MNNDLRWIIVTGATGGVGSCLTRKILEDTEYGVISISSSAEFNKQEITEKYARRFRHLQFDLRNSDGVKELFLKQIAKIGVIYGLVNNSAMAYDDLVTNLNVEKLKEMYNINVFSPMNLTKYAIRNMLLNKTEGSIVHVTSISAHTGYKGLSMYASTKGALEAFSKNAAREWGECGIRSNCISPGFMETAISSSLTSYQKDRIYKRTSLKKATDINSVADAVIFLLDGEKSKSITGTTLCVDNGTI